MRPVIADLFHADRRRTNGRTYVHRYIHDKAKSRFSQFREQALKSVYMQDVVFSVTERTASLKCRFYGPGSDAL